MIPAMLRSGVNPPCTRECGSGWWWSCAGCGSAGLAAFGAPFSSAQVAEMLSCGSEAEQCFSPASWHLHCSHPALPLASSFFILSFFICFLELCGRIPMVKGLSSRPWHRLWCCLSVCPCAAASADPPVPPHPGRDTSRGIFPH